MSIYNVTILLNVRCLYQVIITFIVGSEVHREIHNDFSASGEPFLMGTVALGKIFYFYWQCMYIMIILQCQKVQNNCQILLKRAETDIVPTIFKGVLYHVHAYTVTISYRSLDINQVPEKFY